MRRYDPGYRQVKAALDGGHHRRALVLHNVHRNATVGEAYTSFMTMTDSMIHEVDTTRWLLGEEITAVQVIPPKRTPLAFAHLQDPQFAVFTHRSGILSTVEFFANCQYGYDVRCELVVEVIGAIISGGLALLADAGHMFTDAAGLVIALIAAQLARRSPTDRRTWGYLRAEVLAATLQAAILLAVGTFILIEGIQRLFAPPDVASGIMLVFGVVGLVANIVALLVLAAGRGANFNMRAAFLEVLNDALGSVAVIVAAIVIATTGFERADAIVSIFIAMLILPRTFKLLRETTSVLWRARRKGSIWPRCASTCSNSTTCRLCTTCTRPRWRPVCRCSPRM